MPQLDPAPWFLILLFSWLVFLVVLPPKIVQHTFPYEPTPQNVEKTKSDPWNWPWH